MKQASLRFYEELNDFLPDDKKKRAFPCRFVGEVTVAMLLQAIGVPFSEVDLILRHGESVHPAQAVRDGDRISFYPVFESFDIHGTTTTREEPLRRPCFVAVPGLERLAAYLRMLGFDTRSGTGLGPDEIAAATEAERRILLTCDDVFPQPVSRIFRVRAAKPRDQAAEVLARLDLYRLAKTLYRCSRCNERLTRDGDSWRCEACGMTYCNGVHLRRTLWLIDRLTGRGCT